MYCRRTHQSLASVGVAALVRLVASAGSHMSSTMWMEAVDMVTHAAEDTTPQVADLAQPLSSRWGGIAEGLALGPEGGEDLRRACFLQPKPSQHGCGLREHVCPLFCLSPEVVLRAMTVQRLGLASRLGWGSCKRLVLKRITLGRLHSCHWYFDLHSEWAVAACHCHHTGPGWPSVTGVRATRSHLTRRVCCEGQSGGSMHVLAPLVSLHRAIWQPARFLQGCLADGANGLYSSVHRSLTCISHMLHLSCHPSMVLLQPVDTRIVSGLNAVVWLHSGDISGECSRPAGLVLLQSRRCCYLLLAYLWRLLEPFLAAAHS